MCSITAAAAPLVTNVIGAPIKHFVQGQFTIQNADGSSKIYTITPITLRDRRQAAEFLASYHAEFYRNGEPLPLNKALERVNTLILRLIKGEAWSTWLVRNEDDKIVAWWTIGYDTQKDHLQAALMVNKDCQNQKIANGIWQFTSKYLFPILHRQGAKVQAQTDLKKVNLFALAHPDHTVMNNLLVKAGFELDHKTYDKDFASKIHDGRRNCWKIPVAKILQQ